MTQWDIFTFSFKNFLRRKTRSILTVLGVIIGTAAVVIMLSIGVGMNKGFEDQISQWGNLRQIEVYQNYGWSEDGGSSVETGYMDDISVENIRALENVYGVTPKVTYYIPLIIGRKQAFVSVIGLDPAEMEKFGYTIGTGRLLNGEDKGENHFVMSYTVPFLISNPRKPVYWYEAYQGEPHPFDPLLESYKITMDSSYGQGYQDLSRPKPKLYKATCVGVLKQKGEGLYDENMIVMDINLVMKYQKEYEKQQGGGGGGGDVIIYGDYIVAPGRPSRPGMPSPGGSGSDSGRKHIYNQIVVMVDETKNVQKVEKAIRDMGFSTSSSMSYLTEMQEQTKFLRMILGAIGGISFFVAALSITNTMIMSIYERTREIGVMKVIGCRIRDVRSMFLVEAGIIGIVGGVAGVGLSYGMSALLNSLARSGGGGLFGYSGTSAVSIVPPWLALVALLLATFVGVVSGLYPAIRATRLPALEALRNE